MKNFILSFLLIISLITPTVAVIKAIEFTQQCKGYLKQAADANTVELALDRITKALNYIEENNLTTGYTSVLYKTENENVEFWYNNIKACKHELENAKNSTSLEKTNLLMKVRETLTDNENGETSVTIPPGISRYPNNGIFTIFGWLSAIITIVISLFYYCEWQND